MIEQPSYYSIIPAEVRYDKRLSANTKLLYAEISSLTRKTGECFATTSYFSELYGMCKSSIQKMLSQLEKYGYISRRIEYKKGTKEIEKRYIKLLPYPSVKNYTTPSVKNYTDNNTSDLDNTKIFNNTRNNNNPHTPLKGVPELSNIVYIFSKIVRYHTGREPDTSRWLSSISRWLKRSGIHPNRALSVLSSYYNFIDDNEYMPKVRDLKELYDKFNRLEDYFTDMGEI
jgi:hypothetical protein